MPTRDIKFFMFPVKNRSVRYGLRSKRLGHGSPDMLVVSEVEIESILAMIETTKPKVLVIDSIQTMFNRDLTSAPGSVSQVRESTVRLMLMAKKSGIPTLLVGHVTKDGAIAGPKLLEHMVDTVLYFEGDRNHIFRILRAVKNRFGSTNEIGVFEMKDKGLDEVANPSAVFLSERPTGARGIGGDSQHGRHPSDSGRASSPGQRHEFRNTAPHDSGA